jgi:hypothetical protein
MCSATANVLAARSMSTPPREHRALPAHLDGLADQRLMPAQAGQVIDIPGQGVHGLALEEAVQARVMGSRLAQRDHLAASRATSGLGPLAVRANTTHLHRFASGNCSRKSQSSPVPAPPRSSSHRLRLTPGHRKSTSASTGSARNKSSADSHTNTRSPSDGPTLYKKRAGHHHDRVFEPNNGDTRSEPPD